YVISGANAYVTAESSGLEHVYRAKPSGEIDRVSEINSGVYTSLQGAKQTLVSLWSSAISPAEIVRIDPESHAHKRLTEFNVAQAAELDWLPLRHFTFTSKRGKTIHNMVALPPAFDESKKYPLFVVIHGGPASMWRDEISLRWDYHLLAAPGYVVLLTNYTGS